MNYPKSISYHVFCVSGSVNLIYSGTYDECLFFCREHGWTYEYNEGILGDLNIGYKYNY